MDLREERPREGLDEVEDEIWGWGGYMSARPRCKAGGDDLPFLSHGASSRASRRMVGDAMNEPSLSTKRGPSYANDVFGRSLWPEGRPLLTVPVTRPTREREGACLIASDLRSDDADSGRGCYFDGGS